MQDLNLPPCQLQVRPADTAGKYSFLIFDPLRAKWIGLSPEEWVRQNFVQFLVNHRQYPRELIANEIGLHLNSTRRRCDTVVYNRKLRPLVIVEYKAPSVAITRQVFDQIARYNSVLQAPYLIVSNGLRHFCCRFSGSEYTFLPDIPAYPELINGD